jgi:hypothetical protein
MDGRAAPLDGIIVIKGGLKNNFGSATGVDLITVLSFSHYYDINILNWNKPR